MKTEPVSRAIRLSPSHVLLLGLGILLSLVAISPSHGANSGDLLKPGRFVKFVKASHDQSIRLNVWVDSIRSAIADHQWEYGKRTNEGRLWQGFVPRVKDLHELEKRTRTRTDAFLDSIRSILTAKQKDRLKGLLKKNDLLGYHIEDVPFHHISNSPMNPKFEDRAKAYQIELPGSETAAASWSYADLLNTWTVNKYVRLPDALANQSLVASSDVQVTANSPSLRSLIVRSPLIMAATLMVPDLSKAEFSVLYDHYPHTFDSRESAWSSYSKANGLDEYVVVRLKMSTPYDAYYLSTDRYIIFLEDSEGVGYEPTKIDADPVRKLEALEILIPGQTVTYTDVFGTYTGTPGYKETRTLRNPSKIRYAGQERLLRLYFPARNFEGTLVVNQKTRQLKLIIQPELEDLPRMELKWDLKRKPKARK